jgi:hypothetical protein
MRSFWPVLVLCVAALAASGCHSALDDAMASYTDARYPSAAAQFRALERASRTLDAQDFAGYALYRGLTHLALGDARAAARWLGYAKQAEDRDPSVFNDQDRGALVAAWRSMGHMPGEPGFAAPLPEPRASAAR